MPKRELLTALRIAIADAGLQALLFAAERGKQLVIHAAGPGAEAASLSTPATRRGLRKGLTWVRRYGADAQTLDLATWRSTWNAQGVPR